MITLSTSLSTSLSTLIFLLSLAELESGPLERHVVTSCGLDDQNKCDRVLWPLKDKVMEESNEYRNNVEEQAERFVAVNNVEEQERLEAPAVLLPTNWLQLLADLLNEEAQRRTVHSTNPSTLDMDNSEWVTVNVSTSEESTRSPNDLITQVVDQSLRNNIIDNEQDDDDELLGLHQLEIDHSWDFGQQSKMADTELLPIVWPEETDESSFDRNKRSIVDFDLDPKHEWVLIDSLDVAPVPNSPKMNSARVADTDSKLSGSQTRSRRDIRRRLQLEQLLDELWPLTENMEEEDIVDVFVDYFDDVLDNIDNTLNNRRRRRRSLLTTELDMTKPMEIIYPASDRTKHQESVVDLDKTHSHMSNRAKLDVSLTKRDVKDITRDSDLAQILQWLKALSEGRESEVTAALMVAKKSKDDKSQQPETVFRTATERNGNDNNDDFSLNEAVMTTTTTSTTTSTTTTTTTTTTSMMTDESTSKEPIVEEEETTTASTTTTTTTTTTSATTSTTTSSSSTTTTTPSSSEEAIEARSVRFAEQTFELTTEPPLDRVEVLLDDEPESLRSVDQLDIEMDASDKNKHHEHHHKKHSEHKKSRKHKHRHHQHNKKHQHHN